VKDEAPMCYAGDARRTNILWVVDKHAHITSIPSPWSRPQCRRCLPHHCSYQNCLGQRRLRGVLDCEGLCQCST
jgi:hypothetical protein